MLRSVGLLAQLQNCLQSSAYIPLQVADEAEEALRGHERSKEQLCQELNLLVHQSATAELSKLEQLTKQLESLNG